jgi:two-component system, response regulator RegA
VILDPARRMTTVDHASTLPRVTPLSAFVVDPNRADARSTGALLMKYGFQVTVAETFAKAKERLATSRPALLITEIRLADYNGLQLVRLARSFRPDTAALTLSAVADPVIQADAESLNATFVLKPIDDAELTAAVFRTLGRSQHSVVPIRAPFERRLSERRVARVVPIDERRATDRRRSPRVLVFRAGGGEP